MARRAYEQTGLIPRSIIRTFDRFRKQLFKGGKAAVIQEFRVSRYQVIVSVKCLLSLILIPLIVNFLARTYFLKPLTEYLWNTQQSEIFLNVYQENRAFSELHDFEEKLFFESLIGAEHVPEQSRSHDRLPSGCFLFERNKPCAFTPEVSNYEKLETKKNQSGAFCFANKKNEENDLLYQTPVKNNKKVLDGLLFTPKTLTSNSKNNNNERFLLQTFTNQKLLMYQKPKNVVTENTQQKKNSLDFPLLVDVDLLSINRFKENEIETGRLFKNKTLSYRNKAQLSKQYQKALFPCSSKKDLCWYKTSGVPKNRKSECLTSYPKFPCSLPTQKNTIHSNQSLFFFLREKKNNKGCATSLAQQESLLVGIDHPLCWNKKSYLPSPLCWNKESPRKEGIHPFPYLFYHVDQIEPDLCEKKLESKVVDTKQPFYLENSLTQRFQQKTIELAIYYNQQSIQAIINFLGDLFTFFTITFLFVWMEPQIIILKSFLIESIYSFSDTTKSFLLILLTDLLVGFHSPHGWEILLEIILRHLGLPESQDFIFVFVATFPVLIDTLFKYWIFRYLNRISPSTVVTYHNMIE